MLHAVEADIAKKISRKFGFPAAPLSDSLAKSKGRLPISVKRDVAYLLAAEKRLGHPKRQGQLDLKKLKAIHRSSIQKIGRIDFVAQKAKARALWHAEIAARVVMLVVLAIGSLMWLGVL